MEEQAEPVGIGADGSRWHEIDRMFERALERPAGERLEFISAACGSDAELREAVLELLESHGESISFLSRPPILPADGLEELTAALVERNGSRPDVTAATGESTTASDIPSARPGELIGAWRIVEELGRGGMATVYLAKRSGGDFEQLGALKLLRRGLDTADLVRRFRSERQILSALSHPNIARLLDGGASEDGRPYLVMEPVHGVPITDWCDANECGVDERLRLFLGVARAVHHAHAKLIVHRDLKPSNILVTPDGSVKLLDFGIAKILDPDALPGSAVRTRPGRRALTPEYASPEQIRGGPVTTSTDIYQLGLLLHRLLSGARPRDARGGPAGAIATDPVPSPTPPSRIAGQADRKIAAARSLTPGRLERRLAGDLDTIVTTALRPEEEGRYGSALEMARDIERHLDGLPITARPPSLVYRAKKLLGRHRWIAPVGAAAVVLLGLYITTLQRHRTELAAERNVARQEAARAGRVRDVLVNVFQSSDPWLSEDVPPSGSQRGTILQSLETGAERARIDLAEEPELQIDILTAIAGVYVGLGYPTRAQRLVEETLPMRATLDGSASPSVAAGLRQLGRALLAERWYDSAGVVLERSLELLDAGRAGDDTLRLGVLMDLGFAEKGQGRLEEAERHLVAARRIAEADSGSSVDFLARAHHNLALLYPRLDRPEDALSSARTALELRRENQGESHPETAWELHAYAGMLWRTTHEGFSRAIELETEAIRTLERTLGTGHPRTFDAKKSLAGMLRSASRLDESVELVREILATQAELFGERDPRTAMTHTLAAITLYNRGDLDEARRHALVSYETLSALQPGHPRLGVSLVTLCGIDIQQGNAESAEAACREASEVYGAAGMTGTETGLVGECRFGHLLAGRGRMEEAAPYFQRVVPAIWRARTAFVPGLVRECLEYAAAFHAEAGNGDEAERLGDLASQLSRRGQPGVIR